MQACRGAEVVIDRVGGLLVLDNFLETVRVRIWTFGCMAQGRSDALFRMLENIARG